jgi:hypothetical protein
MYTLAMGHGRNTDSQVAGAYATVRLIYGDTGGIWKAEYA